MTDSIRALFEAHAPGYHDEVRRQLIPPFDAFYGTAVASLAHAGDPLRRVLDLGAGTGLLSAAVAAAYPTVDELVLVDGAPAMLERARERIGGGAPRRVGAARVELRVADLRDPLPHAGEPYDAVVSALAIHHLDADSKRDLFRRAHDALRPGGIFVNAEQVLGSTPELQRRYRAWHRAQSAALGVTAEEWAASETRMAVDIWETVEDQLDWLAQAGFSDPDCPFRDHCFGVFVARRSD